MHNNSKLLALVGLALASATAVPAQADINFSWDGFVRSETAFKASDRENPFNSTKGGNNFIGHPTCEPTAAGTTYCTNTALNPYAGLGTVPADAKLIQNNPGGGRSGQMANNVINMQMFRLELESQVKFNQYWSLQAKLHALVDPGWYDNYQPGQVHSSVESPSFYSPMAASLGAVTAPNFAAIDTSTGGLSAQRANPGGIYGRPNYFKYATDTRFGSNKSFPMPMEWTGRNYEVYFPALFLEYNNGPFNARLGMQQIAWGQALFFRILDVPDGLDLRRHSALDLGSEEFSDKRVPAPALRVNYQINDEIVADAYIQKFQPSVLPNAGTPYNVITDRFSVHDNYGHYTSRGNYGIRLKGQFGDLSLQVIAAHTWNPNGVYRWDITGVHRGLTGLPDGGSAGPDLAKTAFFQDPTGTQAGLEWDQDAAFARGNAATVLSASINDFPGAQDLGAFPITTLTTGHCTPGNAACYPAGMDVCAAIGYPGAVGHPASQAAHDCTAAEVSTFGSLSGGLRGIVTREYYAENIYGGGAGYVLTAEPGSLLDQLIVNVEVQYTPDRAFTAPDFGQYPVHRHEWTSALVMEKYQRFFINLPATYLVFQWEHKTQSDLYGRFIGAYKYYDKAAGLMVDAGGGMGGDVAKSGHGVGGGSDYFVFAFQQPFPNLIWRFDMSILGDKRGGMLVQPAVRWKPNGEWTVNVFYNYLNGHLGTPQENIVSTVDWAKEVAIRIGYQF